MRSRSKDISIHAIVWGVFITYEISVVRGIGHGSPWLNYVCFYPLDIFLFYFNAHFAGTAAAKKTRPIISIIGTLFAEIVLFNLLCCGMDILVNTIHKGQLTVELDLTDLIGNTWRGIYILGLSTGYFFGLRSMANARKAYAMLQLKLEGDLREVALENANLRAQINPHFLFNTLTFIFNTVVTVSETAANCVCELAETMRYAMEPQQYDGKIELYREIEQIKRYVHLNEMRFSNKCPIQIFVGVACYQEHLRVPPLLLPLIENMFKHGDVTNHPAFIVLDYQQGEFHFHTENKKASEQPLESDHIGLSNVRSLLHRYYSDDCKIKIEDLDETFILDLKLKL